MDTISVREITRKSSRLMKVLGRELVSPFDDFWNCFSEEISIPIHQIEEGHSTIFGQEGYQKSSGSLPRWMELPDEALSYHVAHELTHLLMRRQGFPVSVRGLQYGEDSPAARVGSDLMEMISHPALEEILKPYPFNRNHIQEHLFKGALQGIEGSPVPELGTPWWVTWACRFCELQFLLPTQKWYRLEVVYDGRCPDIADKGRELVDIMHRESFQTPNQALKTAIEARGALGLEDGEQCQVLDPRDGKIY